MKLFMILKKEWKLIDVLKGNEKVLYPPGKYEVERVDNPHERQGKWILLKGKMAEGKMIGRPESFINHLSDPAWKKDRVLSKFRIQLVEESEVKDSK